MKTLSASSFIVFASWLTCFLLAPSHVSAESIYLLSTFNTHEQHLKIAESDDGLSFQLLRKSGGENLYTPPTGDVRDPSIVQIGDAWYIAFTAGVFGEVDYFSIIKSTDLLTWVPVANVSVPGSIATWAPEWFLDDDGSIYIFVVKTVPGARYIYWVAPTSGDLTTWSAPQLVTGLPSAIDAHVVRHGATYYLSYRNQAYNGGDYVEIASSSLPTGPYAPYKFGNFAGWGNGGKEGPCLVNLGGNQWRMYISDSSQPDSPLVYADSNDDMATWTPLIPLTSDTNFPPLAHGTVIRRGSPPITGFQAIRQASGTMNLSFWARVGWDYSVQYRDRLDQDRWRLLTQIPRTATSHLAITSDPAAANESQRFYRVVTLAP